MRLCAVGTCLSLAGGMLASAGCEWDLERMIDQPHLRKYEATRYFEDGTSMQRAPEGTVSWRSADDAPLRRSVAADGGFLARIPIELDRTVLRRGRDRFRLFCAPCHGIRADGISPVAAAMTLRPPPSLFEPRIMAAEPGRLFAVVSEGYGLMPSYAHALDVEDRWAVVAFVQALQLSRAVELDALSRAQRREAQRWLR